MKVLDVGSGPISVIRGVQHLPNVAEFVSLDPLAHVYNALIRDSFSHLPHVSFGLSEFVSAFVEGSFDVIYCQNALDHSFDPVRSLVDLLRVLAPGGVLVLQHYQDEGLFENYSGLHHWNFTDEGGNLVFWNREYSVNMSRLLRKVANIQNEVHAPRQGKSIFRSTLKMRGKKPPHLGRQPWTDSSRLYVDEALRALTLAHLGRRANP
jgi:SAM-dependent methyltransferase